MRLLLRLVPLLLLRLLAMLVPRRGWVGKPQWQEQEQQEEPGRR